MTLPNFLVIGAQRSGTTLLHTILSLHKDIYVPRSRKEVHYFDWYFNRGVDWYRSYFPAVNEIVRFQAVGEVTPDYLVIPEVPQRIYNLLPSCRLIVILRQPVDRIYSWYLYMCRSRNERRSFDIFIAQERHLLEHSLYHFHLQRYLKLFPLTALHVMIYEELIQSPEKELQRLAVFLGLTTGWGNANLLRSRVNTSELPRLRWLFAIARRIGHVLLRHDLNWPVALAKRLGCHRFFGRAAAAPVLDPALKTRLSAYFYEDTKNLEVLLGRDIPIWSP